MKLHVEPFSHKGKVHSRNEDSLLVREPEGLFAVADGMGGHPDGDVASALCLQTLSIALGTLRPLATLPPQHDPTERRDALHAALVVANEVVHKEAARRARRTKSTQLMGTTVAGLLFGPGVAVIGHVGDSRIYVLRDKQMFQLTADHTVEGALITEGALPHVASAHPQADVLLAAIGVEPVAEPTVKVVSTRPGDVFLVCSDGLYKELEPWTIATALGDAHPGDALLATALATRCRDNVTGIAVRILD